MTIEDALKIGYLELNAASVPEPRTEAKLLLQHAAGRGRSFIVAHPEYVLTEGESAAYLAFVGRRALREPFQYIVGRQEFYGADLIVTPDVLIPRPETEILVERAIELLNTFRAPRFLEIGVGSGCISVSILKNVTAATAVGIDISTAALKVAASNAEILGVADRLKLLRSDLFDSVEPDLFDLIVSNPPYVPAREMAALQPEVREHEPRTALTDEGDGLSVISRIIAGSFERLLPGGSLLIEIGHGRSNEVAKMLDPILWPESRFEPDLQGIPRVAIARRRF